MTAIAKIFHTLTWCQALEYTMRPLPHPICKAGTERAQNLCKHLMSEGVNDRKYSTALRKHNLGVLVTKQVSLLMGMCIPTQMCAHGVWVRALKDPAILALPLPHSPLPVL